MIAVYIARVILLKSFKMESKKLSPDSVKVLGLHHTCRGTLRFSAVLVQPVHRGIWANVVNEDKRRIRVMSVNEVGIGGNCIS